LVAQQALCSWASLDLAPSNYFQIRNLKYRLRGTWFIDEKSQKIAVKAWSECQNRKFYFQGRGWVFAMAKTIFAGTVEKTGKNRGKN